MASIKTYVDKIRASRYGREVRDAIANALEAVNNTSADSAVAYLEEKARELAGPWTQLKNDLQTLTNTATPLKNNLDSIVSRASPILTNLQNAISQGDLSNYEIKVVEKLVPISSLISVSDLPNFESISSLTAPTTELRYPLSNISEYVQGYTNVVSAEVAGVSGSNYNNALIIPRGINNENYCFRIKNTSPNASNLSSIEIRLRFALKK